MNTVKSAVNRTFNSPIETASRILVRMKKADNRRMRQPPPTAPTHARLKTGNKQGRAKPGAQAAPMTCPFLTNPFNNKVRHSLLNPVFDVAEISMVLCHQNGGWIEVQAAGGDDGIG